MVLKDFIRMLQQLNGNKMIMLYDEDQDRYCTSLVFFIPLTIIRSKYVLHWNRW